MAGLAPDIRVEVAPDYPADMPDLDERGNVVSIRHGDGSVTISTDGNPVSSSAADNSPSQWFDNLAEKLPETELSRVADDLLRGIDTDIESRKAWIEARAKGLKILGLAIKLPALQGASDGAPVEGMSTVNHPLCLEAILRFQANARGELLPSDGPVKVRDDDLSPEAGVSLGDALETDLNHYLTAVATEYYPDTDRMFFMLGAGGTSFKKVYNCPLRGRPVSETVDADDLIVDNDATDLANAKRVTHRVTMRPSTVKRMQILGVYRDVSLSDPNLPDLDAFQRAEKEQQGISQSSFRPEDRDREIYECYCELDLRGYEHRWKGKETGLEIPYRVTIDRSSKHILSIVRNYAEEDQKLPTPKQTFVKYTFVPGFGFYDIGLLHILGNTNNALTAAWRELLDAGMYANFPGFLIAKNGNADRQNTNIFRVPPGGGAQINTNGAALKDIIMPLPYRDNGAGLMNLVESISQTGQRLGGVSEMQVGEGRADAPVGTTLAMIEQAEKILNSVHKRLHSSQAMEFKLLVTCFRENPEAFWQRGTASNVQWDRDTFFAALDDNDLVPQADPNTASHSQRVMKIMALKQLQAANQSLYDPVKVDTAALQAIGWNNPEQFFVPPDKIGAPSPEAQEKIAELQVKSQLADAATQVAGAKVKETDAKIQQGAFAPKSDSPFGSEQQQDTQSDLITAHAKMLDAQTKAQGLQIQQQDAQLHSRDLRMQDDSRDADRASEDRRAAIDYAKDIALRKMEVKSSETVAKIAAKAASKRAAAKPAAKK